tara:strand:- start:1723 stop:2022 length:300 start_codon:yes stop_codon:yes gene_type:complete
MKKGPLSNKEKQFIDNNQSMQTDEIATKLDRSLKVVSKYIDIKSDEETNPTHELFARKPDRGVTVMTEAASIAGDENKSVRTTSTPKRYQGVIHKIKED